MSGRPWGLHWFRRDLRLAGNSALRANLARHDGRVVGLFAIDPAILSRPDCSVDRFAFLLETLHALQIEMREAGGDLVVLEGGPEAAFQAVQTALSRSKSPLPNAVSWNRDYEPFARARDSRMESWIHAQLGCEVLTERDHLLFEPGEILKDPSDPKSFYQVFSPFARKWLQALRSPAAQARILEQKKGLAYLEARSQGKKPKERAFSLDWRALTGEALLSADCLARVRDELRPRVRVPLPEAGSLAAYRALEVFRPRLERYLEDRDFPAVPGGSRLSVYLKNGSLTVPQILAHLRLEGTQFERKDGPTQFAKELIWREFYVHILHHCPHVEERAFLDRYADLPWPNDERLFQAWKEGRTGYPIVDAGMRELATTGFMHNRVRMIVASFLTKDLLIDWRWGERYFMERLLDGDLSANNGGWQWAASTGCDPQPYFRIFNPELQSRKFDPNGDYIRRYVPELKRLDSDAIHTAEPPHRPAEYPEPVVVHSEQKAKALALYTAAR